MGISEDKILQMKGGRRYKANPGLIEGKKQRFLASMQSRRQDDDDEILACFDDSLTVKENVEVLSKIILKLTENKLKKRSQEK